MSRGAPERVGYYRLTEALTRAPGHSAYYRAGIWQLNGIGSGAKEMGVTLCRSLS